MTIQTMTNRHGKTQSFLSRFCNTLTLTDHLFSAYLGVYTVEAPCLRIIPGHYANISEKDTLFKDREASKPIPYSAARTYKAQIGENPSPIARARS